MQTIVLGPNHNNTLGLVWSLGMAGHSVTLLLYKSKYNYVNLSKYIENTIFVGEKDEVLDLLKKVASNMDCKPVVFVTNDVDAALLNEHYSEMGKYCFIEGGNNGTINRYRDKDEGERLAIKCGFTIPKTVLITKPDELSTLELTYPIIIKGNNSIHGGKEPLRKCNKYVTAESFVSGLPHEFFPLQIQEFIKKDYELMLLGCSLYGGKEIICPVANKKIRQYPPNTGGGSWSVSVEVSTDEELRKLADKVAVYMREISYTGNFSAEFLYTRGEYYFLEVNLRNDGTSWLSTCSGFNLPDLVCRSFYEDNVMADNLTFHQMYYMNIVWDLHHIRNKTIKFSEWLKQLNNKTCYSHYNKSDKKPFIKYLLSIVFGNNENKKKHIQ